jgi:hypothetical protein
MITSKSGADAAAEIELWARMIARVSDDGIDASVYDDADSSTYVIRLATGNRVLLFRLSEAQVQSPERETECAKILKTKMTDLRRNL